METAPFRMTYGVFVVNGSIARSEARRKRRMFEKLLFPVKHSAKQTAARIAPRRFAFIRFVMQRRC
jgi:hypothetical protein